MLSIYEVKVDAKDVSFATTQTNDRLPLGHTALQFLYGQVLNFSHNFKDIIY